MKNNMQSEYIWNPWHGCHKCSEGCKHCYVAEIDRNYGIDYSKVKLVKSTFKYPIQKCKNKKAEKYELQYKIPSGSIIDTCTTSDFFIEEADIWRNEAWEFIHERIDCLFRIITKRPQRISQCLPNNWLDGWKNVMIYISVETEERTYERINYILDLPIINRGLMIAPMLEPMDIRPILSGGLIDEVLLGGESYIGYGEKSRVLKLEWVEDISQQCKEYDVPFQFYQTGSRLQLKDGKIIHVNNRDQIGLASFYNLDINNQYILDWKTTAQELELQRLAEQAHRIYEQLTLKDLGIT